MKFYPEGHLIDKAENKASMQTPAALSDAMRDGKILEARSIICDNEHNLIVDLKCMRGIIPREEGALGIREGTVRDIAIISRVNKPVCFIITDFIRDAFGRITAVLSRRKAQERCMAEYIAGLTCGDVIPVRITHLEPFGAFADIGCGIVSLLPIDAISVSRIDHPKERFTVGMEPDEGTYKWGTTITTSYFPLDNSAFFNDCDLNLVDWLAQFTPKIPEANTESFKRAFLGRMLFSGDDVFKPVKVLSGGEKVRCMLSRMMLYGSNVLVLDQPTNHLDLESITAVNNGLMDFKGVVLFSSHDHEFVQTIANRIMVLEDGKLTDRLGTYEDYIASMANTAE